MAKTKAERLEEALRENLKKRKGQERAREARSDESLEPEVKPR